MKNSVVWFFPSVGKLGGAERRLSRIARDLVEKDAIVSEILIKKTGAFSSEKLIEEYKTFVGKEIKIMVFNTNLQIILYLIKVKPNWVCYTDSYFRSIPAIIGGILAKSKLMMLNVTTFASSLQERSKVKKMFYLTIIKVSTRLDVLYPSSYHILKSRFPDKDIAITPGSFTDINKFKPSEQKQNIIVFSGRLIREKNPLLLIEAINSCKEIMRRENYKVIICGAGYLKEDIIKKIEDYLILDLTEVKENGEMETILAEAKVFCSLQHYNNYPSQALLEALACGCYCIVTSDGDSEKMINSECGTLIGHSVEQLRNAMIAAMNFNDLEWTEISFHSRKHCINNFSLEESSKHYKEIFKGENI